MRNPGGRPIETDSHIYKRLFSSFFYPPFFLNYHVVPSRNAWIRWVLNKIHLQLNIIAFALFAIVCVCGCGCVLKSSFLRTRMDRLPLVSPLLFLVFSVLLIFSSSSFSFLVSNLPLYFREREVTKSTSYSTCIMPDSAEVLFNDSQSGVYYHVWHRYPIDGWNIGYLQSIQITHLTPFLKG